MTEVECPVDGCDYQDAVRSVKAHITASKDGEHDGMHGMDVGDSLNGELPGVGDAVDEARNAVVDAADGVLTKPGTEPDEPAEPEQAGAGPEPADESAEPEVEPADESAEPEVEPADESAEPEVEPVEEIGTDGTNGIPVPVNSNYIVIGVALVVVLVIHSRSSSSGSTAEVDDTDSGASESNTGAAPRGLV